MARSEMQPMQVGDALPSAGGTFEEKGPGSRGSNKLGPEGTKERSSNAYGFRGGGRDIATGAQEENNTHVSASSRASYVDR